jgi:hypothetical protein
MGEPNDEGMRHEKNNDKLVGVWVYVDVDML